jgi:hypothetical protein
VNSSLTLRPNDPFSSRGGAYQRLQSVGGLWRSPFTATKLKAPISTGCVVPCGCVVSHSASSGTGWIEAEFLPPTPFIPMMMELAMVCPAERYRELVADLAAERAVLRKTQMMGIARLSSADQAGLLGDKAQMITIAEATGLRMHQHGFVHGS